MNNPTTRFFDELAKVISGAAGAAQGLRNELDALVKAQVDRLVADLELVRRDEFEVVKEMAGKARQECQALKVRIAELEAEIERLKDGPSKSAAKSAKGEKGGKS